MRKLSLRRCSLGLPYLIAWGPMLAVVVSAGCSNGPSRVEPPAIDADDAATGAMELYDRDGDGRVAGPELEAAPPLRAALATLDGNSDDAVDEAEVANRIDAWQASNVGMTLITCRVTLDGRPLAGATVTFEPEPYLGGEVQTAIGTTGPAGTTEPIIPKENRPSPDWPPGIQYGLYKVRISKLADGRETVPAKYNAATTLGHEISGDDPEVKAQLIKFDLKSP